MSPRRRRATPSADDLAAGMVEAAREAIEAQEPGNGAAPAYAVPDAAPADAMHEPGIAVHWLPLLDAAQALGVSPDTVRRRVRRGELPSRHEHGRLLVELPVGTPTAAQAQGEAGELALFRERVSLLERERETLTAELAARRQSETELRALLSQAQTLVARIAPPPRGELVEHERESPPPRRRRWWQFGAAAE